MRPGRERDPTAPFFAGSPYAVRCVRVCGKLIERITVHLRRYHTKLAAEMRSVPFDPSLRPHATQSIYEILNGLIELHLARFAF